MLKFGSKSDVTVVHRATIRLLDDAEIIHCDFQVRGKEREREGALSLRSAPLRARLLYPRARVVDDGATFSSPCDSLSHRVCRS